MNERQKKSSERDMPLKRREPEPAMGPDEEGELPLTPDEIPEGNHAAWVRTQEAARRKQGQDGNNPGPE